MTFSTRVFLLFCCGLLLGFTFSQSESQTKPRKTCKALVLQGGGDKGAYEVGVLYGFIKNAKDPKDFEYDVISGISIGSVNGMGLAQFAKGNESAAIDFLMNSWKTSKQKDVFKPWPGGMLEGLFFKPSLFNNDPEIEYLNERFFTIPDKRKITIATTDFATGQKVIFSEKDWESDPQMAINATLFSSAVPVMFLYRHYKNQTFIDGGWSGEGLDVEDAVFRCREIVDDDQDIMIDVIFATNVSSIDVVGEKLNSYQIYSRHIEIHSFASATRAYSYAVEAFPSVNFRYVMIASQHLPHQSLPLDFKPKHIEFMLNLGYQDAITALDEGPGVSAEKVYNLSIEYQDSLFFNEFNDQYDI